MQEIVLFAGTANLTLATAIAQTLNLPMGNCITERFPDGEISVRLLDSVRQKAVFIIQPTSPPVNDHLVELIAFVDACRRAAASQIIAVIPYFGYARADKRQGQRVSMMASAVAEILQTVGVDRVITFDLHSPQIEGFFRIPVDSLSAVSTLCDTLREKLSPGAVVVSPDTGRVSMATQYAQQLGTSMVVLHKHRENGRETEVTRVIGDVRNRPCLIVDDMISTGGTIAKSVEALLDAGADHEIMVAATHGLLLEDAEAKLNHESIRAIFVTDTISQRKGWAKLHVVSIAPLIATVIQRFTVEESLSDLITD